MRLLLKDHFQVSHSKTAVVTDIQQSVLPVEGLTNLKMFADGVVKPDIIL
jgi:hypothetical protein